jgi:hypothetical protein
MRSRERQARGAPGRARAEGEGEIAAILGEMTMRFMLILAVIGVSANAALAQDAAPELVPLV